MADRCDRCGRYGKTSEINRRLGELFSTSLCGRCSNEWTDLWLKTYGHKSFAHSVGEKLFPIETNDLWQQFIQSYFKERVDFT